jgi:hypothetical protein
MVQKSFFVIYGNVTLQRVLCKYSNAYSISTYFSNDFT